MKKSIPYILCICLVTLYFFFFTFLTFKKGIGIDFATYYAAGKILLLGEIDKLYDFETSLDKEKIACTILSKDETLIYDLNLRIVGKTYEKVLREAEYTFIWITPYLYLPIFALPFQGFSILPFPFAWKIWLAINIFIILFFILILFSSVQFFHKNIKKINLFVILSFLYSPLLYDLGVGNINLLMVLLFSLIYLLVRKKRDIVAGIFLGVVILMKLSPILFFAYFLYRKKFKLSISCLLTTLFLLLVSLRLYGIDVHHKFLQMVKLYALLLELIFLTNYHLYGIESIVRIAQYLLVALIMGISFIMIRNAKQKEEAFSYEFSLVIINLALICVIMFHQYYSFLIIPVVILGAKTFSLAKQYRKPLFVFILSYILMFVSFYHPLMFTFTIKIPHQNLFILPAFLATVLLFLINLYFLSQLKINKSEKV